jgi:hypothetical protein
MEQIGTLLRIVGGVESTVLFTLQRAQVHFALLDTVRARYIDTSDYYGRILPRSWSILKFLLYVWLAFLLEFFNLQRPRRETSFRQTFLRKNKDTCHLAIFFLQHPENFIVYVALPGDDADKFSLLLDKIIFLQAFFVKKFDTLQFFYEKTLISPLTPKPLEQL